MVVVPVLEVQDGSQDLLDNGIWDAAYADWVGGRRREVVEPRPFTLHAETDVNLGMLERELAVLVDRTGGVGEDFVLGLEGLSDRYDRYLGVDGGGALADESYQDSSRGGYVPPLAAFLFVLLGASVATGSPDDVRLGWTCEGNSVDKLVEEMSGRRIANDMRFVQVLPQRSGQRVVIPGYTQPDFDFSWDGPDCDGSLTDKVVAEMNRCNPELKSDGFPLTNVQPWVEEELTRQGVVIDQMIDLVNTIHHEDGVSQTYQFSMDDSTRQKAYLKRMGVDVDEPLSLWYGQVSSFGERLYALAYERQTENGKILYFDCVDASWRFTVDKKGTITELTTVAYSRAGEKLFGVYAPTIGAPQEISHFDWSYLKQKHDKRIAAGEDPFRGRCNPSGR